jgi:hypothetical protein
MILTTTLGRTAAAEVARSAAVRIWGFRGPLGGFIGAWGGIAMLASAPFDNWWHNAYGLDVKIISPPHTVLAFGLIAIQLGALVLIAGRMNRQSGRARSLLRALFLYTSGFILLTMMTFKMEYTNRVMQHSGTFYRVVMSVMPPVLVGVRMAAGERWGATLTAAVYTAVMLLLLWVLPLFPATAKLGPVYHPVTHFIPAGFPLLLIAPALAVDLAYERLAARLPSRWLQALLLGLLVLTVFIAVQWPMAELLLSRYAGNRFFGSHYVGYASRRYLHDVRDVFYDADGSPAAFYFQMGLSGLAAVLASRLGLAFGHFIKGLRR